MKHSLTAQEKDLKDLYDHINKTRKENVETTKNLSEQLEIRNYLEKEKKFLKQLKSEKCWDMVVKILNRWISAKKIFFHIMYILIENFLSTYTFFVTYFTDQETYIIII